MRPDPGGRHGRQPRLEQGGGARGAEGLHGREHEGDSARPSACRPSPPGRQEGVDGPHLGRLQRDSRQAQGRCRAQLSQGQVGGGGGRIRAPHSGYSVIRDNGNISHGNFALEITYNNPNKGNF